MCPHPSSPCPPPYPFPHSHCPPPPIPLPLPPTHTHHFSATSSVSFFAGTRTRACLSFWACAPGLHFWTTQQAMRAAATLRRMMRPRPRLRPQGRSLPLQTAAAEVAVVVARGRQLHNRKCVLFLCAWKEGGGTRGARGATPSENVQI